MAERNALGHSMGLRDSDAIRHTFQFRYLRDSGERHIRQKTGGRLFAKERNRLEWLGLRVIQGSTSQCMFGTVTGMVILRSSPTLIMSRGLRKISLLRRSHFPKETRLPASRE